MWVLSRQHAEARPAVAHTRAQLLLLLLLLRWPAALQQRQWMMQDGGGRADRRAVSAASAESPVSCRLRPLHPLPARLTISLHSRQVFVAPMSTPRPTGLHTGCPLAPLHVRNYASWASGSSIPLSVSGGRGGGEEWLAGPEAQLALHGSLVHLRGYRGELLNAANITSRRFPAGSVVSAMTPVDQALYMWHATLRAGYAALASSLQRNWTILLLTTTDPRRIIWPYCVWCVMDSVILFYRQTYAAMLCYTIQRFGIIINMFQNRKPELWILLFWFHDLWPPIFCRTVWSVICTHKTTPAKRVTYTNLNRCGFVGAHDESQRRFVQYKTTHRAY